MRVRYIGKSFGVEGLTNGKEYEAKSIEEDMLRVIDDSGEDYLYSATKPCSLEDNNECGRWEIVEDSEEGELSKIIR